MRDPDRVLSNRSFTPLLCAISSSRPIVVTVFMWHPPNRGHLIGNHFSASVEEAVHGINCRLGDHAQSKPVLNWAVNEGLHLILLPSSLALGSRKSFFQRHRYSSPAIRATVVRCKIKAGRMKTYQECVKEYDDKIPHRSDAYMLGFLDTIAFIFNKTSNAGQPGHTSI